MRRAREAGHFCVNVLHRDQRSQRHRFWTAPRRSICRQPLKHKFGTHSIIIGVVEEVRIREAIDPLLNLDGQFVSAKALASATVDRA